MKKKLLFIAPDYYDFDKVVLDGLLTYSGYEVMSLTSNFKYRYKNFTEKIYNFFLKTFLRKNLKRERTERYILEKLDQAESYDVLLVNAPYLLTPHQLDIALKKSKQSIVIFWDSIKKIPMQEDYINKFDVVYSFEPEDCKRYGLKKITNFYFSKEKSLSQCYDVCYLATYDDRIGVAERIFDYFKTHSIKAKGRIFVSKAHKKVPLLPQNIEVTTSIMPFTTAYKYYLDSKIILDIAHPHQKGLSFRPYEAIGFRKKLITTNKDIRNYDFYNPHNIFVIDDVNDFVIPETFFNTDYCELPSALKEKYHIKNWIKHILDDEH